MQLVVKEGLTAVSQGLAGSS